jgi:hypothetical protein
VNYFFLFFCDVLPPQIWARNEAVARAEIKENGGEIVFGTYYHQQPVSYTAPAEIDAMPELAERE